MDTESITITKDKVIIAYKGGKIYSVDKRGLIGPTKDLLRDLKIMTRYGTIRRIVR